MFAFFKKMGEIEEKKNMAKTIMKRITCIFSFNNEINFKQSFVYKVNHLSSFEVFLLFGMLEATACFSL